MYILMSIFLVIIIVSVISTPKLETFKIVRKRSKGKVQIGTLNNTPGPVKDLMVDLNKVGGQMVADSKYDTVATGYLNEENIP